MPNLPRRRPLNFLVALFCAGLIGFALYMQTRDSLSPCPLCVLQRIAFMALGAVSLLAFLHGPRGWGRRLYAVLAGLFAAAGAGVAGWHVYLQHLPPDQVPSCGPGLNYLVENFPPGDALRMVFMGSGEYARVHWGFLGLSLPEWTLIWFVLLGGLALWNNLRRA